MVTLIKCCSLIVSQVVPWVSTLTKPVPFGIPSIVKVCAAASRVWFNPAGKFTNLIPVAEPPYLNVIGSILSPSQTVCSLAGAVVWTKVGWALIVTVVLPEYATSHTNSPESKMSLSFTSLNLVVWSL